MTWWQRLGRLATSDKRLAPMSAVTGRQGPSRKCLHAHQTSLESAGLRSATVEVWPWQGGHGSSKGPVLNTCDRA